MNIDEVEKLLDKKEMTLNKKINDVNIEIEKGKAGSVELMQKYFKSQEFDYTNLLLKFKNYENERQKFVKNIRDNSLKLKKFNLNKLYKYKTKYYDRLIYIINRKIRKLIKKIWW